MKIRKIRLGKYFFDFVSVFFAVIAAFTLNNWNDNRKDATAEEKILLEIRNGLLLDLENLEENNDGHWKSIDALEMFETVLKGGVIPQDSIQWRYSAMTANATSIVNSSGYESLKSRGLELIKNDYLRIKIITLYEVEYQNMGKYEEELPTTQFYSNYFMLINDVLYPYFSYDENGNLSHIDMPIILPEDQKKLLLSYIWQMRTGRATILYAYISIKKKINLLLESINKEIEARF